MPPIYSFTLATTALLACSGSLARGQAHIVTNPQLAGATATQVVPVGELNAPTWLNLPSSADFAPYMPERAKRKGRTGSAVLKCIVQPDGRLGSCLEVSETPAGLDFGAAALKMIGLFRMAGRTSTGLATAGLSLTLTVEFPPP